MDPDLIREEETQVELEEAQTESAPESIEEDTADTPEEETGEPVAEDIADTPEEPTEEETGEPVAEDTADTPEEPTEEETGEPVAEDTADTPEEPTEEEAGEPVAEDTADTPEEPTEEEAGEPVAEDTADTPEEPTEEETGEPVAEDTADTPEEPTEEEAGEPVAEDTADTPGEVPIDIEVSDPSSVEVETFDDSVSVTETDTGTDSVTVTATTDTDTDTVTETDGGVPIEDGTTSVALDAEVLTAAAGLTLSGTENTVDPASDEFAVGFDITEESDFTFSEAEGFAPVGGTIEHTGTVTFDSAAGDITVGDFSIGFDESRASDTTSGFFVANTVEGVLPDGAVLFDVGIPDGVEADADSLDIGTADLLVANEFAGVLQETELASEDLTGADVGDAAIAGVSEPMTEEPVAEEPAEPAEPAEPVVEEPVAEEPAEPVVEEPVAEEPAEPVVEEPVVEEPAEPAEPAEPTDSGLIEIDVSDNGHLDLDFLEDLGIFSESEIEPEPEVEPAPEVEAAPEPKVDSAAEVTVQDGTTSIALDSEILTDAAGLTLSSSENTVDPISEDFAVGFDITEESDFTLSGADDLAPVGGTIEHTGTVTFDSAAGDITVGDFSVGFDESRASDTTSGFFVANTVEGVLPDGAILFDVGVPQSLDIADDGLSLGGSDLLVSNEFASVLQETELASADLTGADVGDANLDALFG